MDTEVGAPKSGPHLLFCFAAGVLLYRLSSDIYQIVGYEGIQNQGSILRAHGLDYRTRVPSQSSVGA